MNRDLISIGGVVLTGISAEWSLRSRLDTARGLRISPGITATTQVAVGTSMLELTTTMAPCASKKMEGVNDHG